ncbi:MAG: nitroreductase family protein [Tidjanibacter sp.]|nr:nitroreductase family protein [Tidjanibacter sp.]
MKRTFMEALINRRSYYRINNQSKVSDREIVEMIDSIVLNMPSAFNVQASRLVLLLGRQHEEFWTIVKEVLQGIVAPDKFDRTREKIDRSFAAGHGTVLFYEDTSLIEEQKRSMPLYADKFDEFSTQTSAMHQFAVWTQLEDMGFGASLQHYNPLIDERVAQRWMINPAWLLKAQMPFGCPLEKPAERTHNLPMEQRRLVFD